jgi:hypothetical protein
VAQAASGAGIVLRAIYQIVSDATVSLSEGDVMRLLSTASMPLATLPRLLHAAAEEAQGVRRSTGLEQLAGTIMLSLGFTAHGLAELLESLSAAEPPSRALAAALAGRALSQQALLSWLSTSTASVAYFYALRGEQAVLPADLWI